MAAYGFLLLPVLKALETQFAADVAALLGLLIYTILFSVSGLDALPRLQDNTNGAITKLASYFLLCFSLSRTVFNCLLMPSNSAISLLHVQEVLIRAVLRPGREMTAEK